MDKKRAVFDYGRCFQEVDETIANFLNRHQDACDKARQAGMQETEFEAADHLRQRIYPTLQSLSDLAFRRMVTYDEDDGGRGHISLQAYREAVQDAIERLRVNMATIADLE